MKNKTRLLFALPIFALFAACAFFSCSGLSGSFNNDVHEYFDVMTNTAAIAKHAVLSPTQKGNGGALCVSSADGPVSVEYYLQNPKLFIFSDATEPKSLEYSLVDSVAASLPEATGVSVLQSMADPSVITVTYATDFLVKAEGGFFPITENLHLYHPYSHDDFGSYSFALYCNSEPPLMRGGVCLADDSSPSKAVLFMNLPNEDSLRFIHKDLAYIEIGGNRFPIESETLPGTVNFTGMDLKTSGTINVNQTTGAVTYGGKTYTRFAGNAVYSRGAAGTTLFYQTSDKLEYNKTYTIKLVDRLGLSSSIEIDASANQLGEVTFENTSGQTVTYKDSFGTEHKGAPEIDTIYGDSGRAYLVLLPPSNNSDANITYRVYKDNEATANFVKSGTLKKGKGSIIVPCPQTAGDEETYVVKAFAQKNLWADSPESTCTVKTKPFTYTGGGGLSCATNMKVWANTIANGETLTLQKGSVNISLVATQPDAANSTTDVIDTGVDWSWKMYLADAQTTAVTPNGGSSSAVSFTTTAVSTEYTYRLEVIATYEDLQNVFWFNVKFTD